MEQTEQRKRQERREISENDATSKETLEDIATHEKLFEEEEDQSPPPFPDGSPDRQEEIDNTGQM
ncbi:MAG: hypothetical protein ABR555_09600 [Pyrinomonadaceae bacterium]